MRVDGPDLGRRPARGGRVPADATTCARGSARSRAPTLVARRRARQGDAARRTPRRSPTASPARARDRPGRRPHREPRGARRGERRAARAPRRRRGPRVTEWRWIEVFARQLSACALSARRGRRGAVGVGQPARAGRDQPPRGADARRAGSTTSSCRRRPTAARCPSARRAPRSRWPGNRGAIAALAAADLVIDCTVEGLLHAPELGDDPGRRRARADDQQRAPGELRALRRRPHARRARRARGRAARGARARCG